MQEVRSQIDKMASCLNLDVEQKEALEKSLKSYLKNSLENPTHFSLSKFQNALNTSGIDPKSSFGSELLGQLSKHYDFDINQVAVFKTGQEGYREMLAQRYGQILQIDALIAKEELDLPDSHIKAKKGMISAPQGIVSAFTKGTSVVKKWLERFKNTEDVNKLARLTNECVREIDLESYQGTTFFLAVIGEFDAHDDQFVVISKQVKDLDVGRHSASADAVKVSVSPLWGLIPQTETLPLLRNALFDLPHFHLELTDKLKQQISNYNVQEIEEKLKPILYQDKKKVALELKKSRDDLELLSKPIKLEYLKTLWQKYGRSKRVGGVALQDVRDPTQIIPYLQSRIKGKIKALEARTDQFQSLDPRSMMLQMDRIKKAQEHIRTEANPTMLSLLKAMYPETMLFYEALRKIKFQVGNIMGLAPDQWTCEKIIRIAKSKPHLFTKSEMKDLESAQKKLEVNAISEKELYQIISV